MKNKIKLNIQRFSYTPYEPINFENGTLKTPGSVNLATGEITMPVYEGKAPVNAKNLNHVEAGIANLEASSIFYQVIGEIDESTGEITYYDTTQTVSSDTK